ncbi:MULTISPECIES: LysE family translocator [Shewanella]|jgi:threonine/homoserine/homoserine lactone efflux protein|uniref:LysE family translocator n=1 Tax=Shewanella livingstonensis TaxID=150120 RepID=A0A3G8LYP4_9GAMM|nr:MULTISPECIES: LysE family translocator [Shewanella]AZG73870.1 LysE family translocator [Shewanella livingstonensis]MBB1363569.1 LysE family translocator [Shewanella sp. SR44-4]MBO1894917.1 LysE family translocator [Shewanella sp. BF02_Schw]PKH32186.1 LysE family translocator [Shewanella sp. ALD9]QHS14072.1 LysE family translocator [Shewanella sp. Arc9-LZ]|tara:strand:- start:880 stop:1485 length:606 start_codon:yes stop_codon:yes gene_type:complete
MELVFAIALFAFSAGITPGPNNIMLMTSGVNFGIKRSIPHLMGISLGFPTMILAVGLGLSAIFQAYPFIHIVIKVIGISYLLYLSWLIANSSSKMEGKKVSKPFSFLQAAAFQWVNPKGWIMAVGAIATFTSVQQEINSQVVTIASVFLCVAFPCAIVWLGFGVALKRLLKNERQQRIFNITMALLLVASIIPMMLPPATH